MLTRYFYPAALFLVGAASLVMLSGYSLGFYLLCFVGLALWGRIRDNLMPPETWYFFWPLLVYAIGHFTLAIHEKWAISEFNDYLPYVLVLFGAWGIRKYKPRAEWFWVGLAMGATGAAIFAGYQYIGLGIRAGGYLNPIQFGNIALLMGVLCMVHALVICDFSRLNILLWVGFVSGLAASVWSLTRGGWLALVLIFIWIFSNATKGWTSLRRFLMAVTIFIGLCVPVFQSNGIVQSRISQGVAELQEYIATGEQNNSVGVRLGLWSVGLEGIKNAPFFGQGSQGWLATRDAAIADGKLASFGQRFTHLHNEYLDITFKRGVVGLMLYLTLYLVPMLMFFRPHLHHPALDVRALAMAGMVIPMMFMDFGLTQTFLSHNSGRVVLCSFWMCVAALMLNAIETSTSSNPTAPSH